MANNINRIQVQGTTYDLRDPALSVVNGIVKCDGAGVLAAAVEGTDYQAPLSATQMLWYGECSTGQSTVAKTATIAGLTEIKTGLHVAIKFTSAQRATNPTLNINQLGAYPMKIYGTTAVATYEWIAGSLIEFVFDGTNWIIVDGRRATTSYYGVTKLATSATSTNTQTALTPASLNNFWLSCISPFPTFLTSQDYAVGDYVRYSYNIYRCKTATAAGAWASISANFDEMPTIWELIQDVSSDVSSKADLTALNSKADLDDLAYTKSTLAAGTTAVLSNRVVHGFKPNNGASSLTCTLPDAVANRCRDFILDIDNSMNTSALGLEFSGLGTSFMLVSRDTADVAEMTQIDARAMARMYFTETALSSNSKPVIVIDRITFSDIVTA